MQQLEIAGFGIDRTGVGKGRHKKTPEFLLGASIEPEIPIEGTDYLVCGDLVGGVRAPFSR